VFTNALTCSSSPGARRCLLISPSILLRWLQTSYNRLLVTITLRIADDADADALRTLAELDSRAVPPGPALIAEVDGRLQAALGLDGGEAIADPFRRTAHLVELLRVRAAQLAGRRAPTTTTLSALERRSTDLRSAKPLAALRRLA
jgi:hypothetical protein